MGTTSRKTKHNCGYVIFPSRYEVRGLPAGVYLGWLKFRVGIEISRPSVLLASNQWCSHLEEAGVGDRGGSDLFFNVFSSDLMAL